MESIPNDLVGQIYDNFLDLCMLEHKEKFVNVLEELSIKIELTDTGFRSKLVQLTMKIFCYDRNVVNAIIAMEKINGNWRRRHSWVYIYDDCMYTSGIIQTINPI